MLSNDADKTSTGSFTVQHEQFVAEVGGKVRAWRIHPIRWAIHLGFGSRGATCYYGALALLLLPSLLLAAYSVNTGRYKLLIWSVLA